jgi:signal transduction histidine kinase
VRGRPWSWITGRPRLTDALIVLFSFAVGALSLLGTNYGRSVLYALLVIALVQALALFWRRTEPRAVLLVVFAAWLVAFAMTPDHEHSGPPALAFAVYAVSVYHAGRARLIVAGLAIATIAVAITFLVLGDFAVTRILMPAAATSLVAWVIGDYIRSRRRFFADLVARHSQERELAAEEERLRIARELHDVVAHNVSLMAIQAGAARVSGNSSSEALRSIETTARDTLAELNRLLGVLRKDAGATVARSPQPGLGQVESLLKPARDAGIDVRLKLSGEQRALPAALDLSSYRILQEAMTNVLKHAHASRVEVGIDYGPNALVLSVRDNGGGSREAQRSSSGHGLIGMRERVDLFGGDLSTASSSLGGFTVRATLPVNKT